MRVRHVVAVSTLALGFLATTLIPGAQATVPIVHEAIDASTTGGEPYFDSTAVSTGSQTHNLSQDGRFAVFTSESNNLVSTPSLTTRTPRIYVRDRHTDTTSLISVNSSGTPANQQAGYAVISANGRYVVYTSTATNLTSDYTNGSYNHLFMYDRVAGTTQVVDKDSNGTFQYYGRIPSSPQVSADGKYVLFKYRTTNSSYPITLVSGPTFAANVEYLFLKNMVTGAVTHVTPDTTGDAPNAAIDTAFMSCAGDMVAFSSTATDLVSTSTNGYKNIYLRNLLDSSTTNITQSADAYVDLTGLSCNGQNVGLTSPATNLTSSSITGGLTHGYSYSRVNGDYILVSKSSGGTLSDSSVSSVTVSDNGKYATFLSQASNLTTTPTRINYVNRNHIFLRNIETSTTELITAANSTTAATADSFYPTISADGRYVLYLSQAHDLIAGHGTTWTYGNTYLLYATRTGADYDY